MKTLKLGSLFDGSGGFPLAGVLHGIEPVWASEIEPFPIRVTKARFPKMKHLGSVTDINGAEIEPVDIITFGSPCQDLSVAGKQLGIHEGQRSNLFFEAIRIIKEMREHDRAIGRSDNDVRPRFAVWENVPGAFSSNKGRDFQAVLQALCSIRGGQDHIVPMPPKNKWLPAGCIVGNGWSVAWRVYDAQFWGVPQRRKRIYLIADFGSERAGEILFERESGGGDSSQGGEAGEGIADHAERSVGRSDSAFNESGIGYWMNGFGCLRAEGENRPSRPNHVVVQDGVQCLNPWDCQSKRQYSTDGVYRTLDSGQSQGGQAHGVVYPINTMVATRGGKDDMRTCFGIGEANDPQFTLSAAHEHAVCYGIDQQGGKGSANFQTDVAPTLCSDSHGTPHAVCFQCCGDRKDPSVSVSEKAYCLPANPMSDRQQAVCFQQNQREEVRDMGQKTGSLTAEPGMHNQNYLCYPDVARSLCARFDSSPCVDRGQNVVAIDCRNMCANEELSSTIQAKNQGGHSLNYINPVCYPIENHPADSRIELLGGAEPVQTLTSRMGTGGGNVPYVLIERENDE